MEFLIGLGGGLLILGLIWLIVREPKGFRHHSYRPYADPVTPISEFAARVVEADTAYEARAIAVAQERTRPKAPAAPPAKRKASSSSSSRSSGSSSHDRDDSWNSPSYPSWGGDSGSSSSSSSSSCSSSSDSGSSSSSCD